ncbi:MAG: DUF4115 domain-containing protein [Acidimicrobiales bacterium]
MVAMTLVVVIGAACLLGAAALRGLRRRALGDERHSVRDYQQTLETLRHVADNRAVVLGRATSPVPERSSRDEHGNGNGSGNGHANGNGHTNGAASATPAPTDAPPPRRAGTATRQRATAKLASSTAVVRPAAPSRPARPRFEPPEIDATHGAAPISTAVREIASGNPLLTSSRPQRPNMPPGRRATHRPQRRRAAVAAAAVAVIGVTAAALALEPSHPARTNAALHPAAPSSSPAPSTRAGRSGAAPSTVTLVSSSAGAATYKVAHTPFAVSVVADSSCWIEAIDPATGRVLWTGTLTAGQSQTIPGTSSMLLRLGAPSHATVTVDGSAVPFPAGFATPFDLTLEHG